MPGLILITEKKYSAILPPPIGGLEIPSRTKASKMTNPISNSRPMNATSKVAGYIFVIVKTDFKITAANGYMSQIVRSAHAS